MSKNISIITYVAFSLFLAIYVFTELVYTDLVVICLATVHTAIGGKGYFVRFMSSFGIMFSIYHLFLRH